MSRFLAIDWDQNQLHIVAAELRAVRVKAQPRRPFGRSEQSPNLADADAARQLPWRPSPRRAGIAPAPVLASASAAIASF